MKRYRVSEYTDKEWIKEKIKEWAFGLFVGLWFFGLFVLAGLLNGGVI